MKALYISLLSSDRLLDKIQRQSGINPGFAGVKFNRLIIKGMSAQGVDTCSFASIPANKDCSQKIWLDLSEKENGVAYKYIPFVNIPLLKQICTVIYTFLYLLFWGLGHRRDRFVMLDVINVSLSLSCMAACRITGVKTVGIVTDMPGLMVASSDKNENKGNKTQSVSIHINQKYISKFDCYVLLTEQMNEVINTQGRPYIVMEGIVDSTLEKHSIMKDCNNSKSLLYAGGLHELYGLKTLVEAFMTLKNPNYRLILYGSGPYVEEIKKNSLKDTRIEYHGIAPNSEVMEAEMRASVLVNPRPTTEEFTKYSFPSKNMEYMSTGRPLLTTKLPGMPKEYYDYVYLFDDETIEGYANTINSVLSKTEDDLTRKGQEAKEWVLNNKNNILQSGRILSLVKSIM